MTALSFAALLLPSTPLPRLAIVAPIVYFAAVLSDLATATILLADRRTSPVSRSTFALALAFVAGGLLLLGAMLVLPLLPSGLSVIEAPKQAGVWLFVFWHATVALGALAYVPLRADDRELSPRFAFIAAATGAGLVSADGVFCRLTATDAWTARSVLRALRIVVWTAHAHIARSTRHREEF